ncbi:adenylosuccinate synthase [Mycobacteroides chelonae]
MTAPRKSPPRKATPTDAAKPDPRKSAQARKAEAIDGFVTVEQCGVKFQIGLGENMPFEVFEEMSTRPEPQTEDEQRKYNLAITKALLGPDQWEAFRSARPTVRDYNELSDKITALLGN